MVMKQKNSSRTYKEKGGNKLQGCANLYELIILLRNKHIKQQ